MTYAGFVAIYARVLLHSTIAFGLVVLGLVSACSDAEEEAPATRAPRPLPGASSPAPSEGDTTPSQTTASAGKCEELGSLAGATGDARYVNSELRSLSLPLASRAVPSKIAVIGIGTRSQLLGTEAVLGAAQNANYETCTHCIVIAVGCTTDCTAGTWFYPRSGKATFNAVPSVSGESFKGTFTDVTLEEVRVDFATGISTPVPSGACFHVSTLSFDAVAKSESGTTTSSSGTTTDSGTIDSGGGSSGGSSGEPTSSGGTGSSSGTGEAGKGGDTVRTTKSTI